MAMAEAAVARVADLARRAVSRGTTTVDGSREISGLCTRWVVHDVELQLST